VDFTQVLADVAAEPDMHVRCHLIELAGLQDRCGLVALLDVVGQAMQSDPSGAQRLAEVCACLGDRDGYVEVAAKARYQRARVHTSRGEPDLALVLIDEAHNLYVQGGHELQALRTNLGRMHVLDELGRHVDAAAIGEDVLHRLECLHASARPMSDSDTELALWLSAATHENLGVAYGYVGSHGRAMEAYATAEEAFEALSMESDLARVRASRGVELVELGRAREALDVLRISARQFDSDGDLLWYGKCLGHQAVAHLMLGSFVEALSLLEQARGCLDGLGARAESSRLTAALAEVAVSLSIHAEAHDLATQAVVMFHEAGMVHDLANAQKWCGVACAGDGRTDAALRHFEESERLLVEIGAEAAAAEVTLAVAAMLKRLGGDDLAKVKTEAATDILMAGDSPARLAVALLHLADLSEPDRARLLLERAKAIVIELPLPSIAWRIDLRLGWSFRQSGQLDLAKEHLEAAVDVVDRLQGSVPDEALRAVFLGDKLEPVFELADFLLAPPSADVGAAFSLCDQVRSRTLRDMTGARNHAAVVAAPAGETQSAESHRALGDLYTSLLDTPAYGQHKAQQSLLTRAGDLERSFTVAHMTKAGSAHTPTTVRSGPASVSAELGYPVLAYEVLRGDVHAFVVHGQDVVHRALPVPQFEISATIEELTRHWSTFRLGSAFLERNALAVFRTGQDLLGTLYDQLIRPVVDLLAPHEEVGRLAIVPAGVLHRVPFHALTDGASDLSQRWTLTVAPSASWLRHVSPNSPQPRRRPITALVMGISDDAIPHAEREAVEVAAAIPSSRLFVNDQATAGHFFANAPGTDVIHLACHGLHRAENPLFSALRLADGWITAREIMNMSLDGATVVLSACESGRNSVDGAEPLGLGWAFLAAGAAAVVVSLWSVQDDVAPDLMAEFYRCLVSGSDAASSLRSAQRITAQRFPHAYHWAPFVTVGHMRLSPYWSLA
jgi:tetratricopeptide (TPR) repeat protein